MNYLFAVAILILKLSAVLGNELARGFNDDIDWVNLEDGKKLAKEQKKPALVLIHKSWCGACKSLKPKFATNMDIQKLSKEFVMINIMDDEEPKDRQYAPDGGYIPRVLFMNSLGKVQDEIINEGGNAEYKYFYPEPKNIYKSMQKAMKAHQSAAAEEL